VNSFSVEQFDVVSNILKNIMESLFRKEQQCQARREGGDYDDEVEAVLQKEVFVILCYIQLAI